MFKTRSVPLWRGAAWRVLLCKRVRAEPVVYIHAGGHSNTPRAGDGDTEAPARGGEGEEEGEVKMGGRRSSLMISRLGFMVLRPMRR